VIILRYLSREILVTMLAVSSILLLIVMSGRFARYLAEATTGRISVDVLFTLIGYRMPEFLILILPLGLFIAILLAYGRIYIESEMVVLSACGMSQRQLVIYTLIPAVIISAVVAAFSLWLGPLGAQKTETLLLEQRQRSEFDALQEGRFQSLGKGQAITYIESLSNNRKRLNHVFVAQADNDPSRENLVVIIAESGEQILHPEYDQRYLILHQGKRYEGRPGSSNYAVMSFETYGQYKKHQMHRPQSGQDGPFTAIHSTANADQGAEINQINQNRRQHFEVAALTGIGATQRHSQQRHNHHE
jgi:lipopolysaccharide export system permease protein